jgi:hypothetical protein
VPAAAIRESQAIVLRRTDATASAGNPPRVRVVQRLLGAGMASDSGVITLGELDRRALGDGRLGIMHVTSATPLGVAATLVRQGR